MNDYSKNLNEIRSYKYINAAGMIRPVEPVNQYKFQSNYLN